MTVEVLVALVPFAAANGVEVLVALVPFAAAIAVSPLTIAFVIGLLLSTGARTRTRTFVVVWFGLLTAVAVALLLVLPAGAGVAEGGGGTRTAPDVAVGVLLAVLAVAALWRVRRRDRVRPLVTHLDALTPRRTAAVAAVLALNPKNLALVLGGAVAVPLPGPSPAASVVAGAGFGLIASVPLLLALPVAATTSPRVEGVLDRTHAWAIRHGDLLAAVVLAVLSAMLITRGLAA